MKLVNPIKNLNVLDSAFEYLENKNYRDFMILFLGVNTGLRISDLLKLTIFDVRNKDYIEIKEGKTKKNRKILILKHVKIEIEIYLNYIKGQTYLFEPKHYRNKPLSRKSAYNILKKVEIKFNLERLGTHTLRKTFGYHFYKSTNDIATLMIIFNHIREDITLRYIGIKQDRIDSQTAKWGGIKKNKFKVIKCEMT
jgi:integrase